MRIAVAAFEHLPFGSGIGTVASEVGGRLAARGHDVVTVAPGFPGISVPPALVFKTGGIGIATFWRQAHALIARGRFDAVWSNNPLFAKEPPCAHVATVHTTFHSLLEQRAFPAYLRPYYAAMTAVESRRLRGLRHARFTAIDPKVARELRAIGVPGDVEVINNGVNVATYAPSADRAKLRVELGLDKDATPLVLTLGRFTAAKRPIELVRAWAEHERSGGAGTLLLAGHGELTERTLAEVRKLGLQRARFIGAFANDPASQARKLRFLQAADAFVIASAYEGKPLALLEALACGAPAIVSDIPNLRFVADEGAGVVADFSDAKVGARGMGAFLGDAGALARARDKARAYALANADWDRIVDRYEHALREAAEAK